jgi:hypothetical protein
MSRASNSLFVSDVATTPIKLKYSSSYSNTAICDSGIYAQSGLNGPVTVTGSVPQRTLRYLSIRHLFYSNFLTGSYMYSTSSADNFLQSTAASGTFENNTTLSSSADIRYFPTESLSKIKIINIPKNTFGEKVSRKSFFLTGSGYYLADDGNGNVIDRLSNNTRVGNVIYPQGFVIITNPNYYCVMDGGPFTFPKTYTFDIKDSPKTFNPITDAQPDCAPINTNTVTLYTGSSSSFPSSTIDSSGNVTLTGTNNLINIVGTYRSQYTVKSTYCASSDKQPITVKIVDCKLTGVTLLSITPTPTAAPTLTPAPTPSPTPTCPPTAAPPTATAPPPTPTATLPPPTPTATLPPPTATIPPPTPTATLPPPTATIPPPTPTATLPPPTSTPAVNYYYYNMSPCTGVGPKIGRSASGGLQGSWVQTSIYTCYLLPDVAPSQTPQSFDFNLDTLLFPAPADCFDTACIAPPTYTTWNLTTNGGDLATSACPGNTGNMGPSAFYSSYGASLGNGTVLYTTTALTPGSEVAAQYYSNGIFNWDTFGVAGTLQNQAPC